jgi:hypothetical protein
MTRITSRKPLTAALLACLCGGVALAATPKQLMLITGVTLTLETPDGSIEPVTPSTPPTTNLPEDASIRVEIATTRKDVGVVLGRKLNVVLTQGNKEIGRKSLDIKPADGVHRFALTFTGTWEACTPINVDVSVTGQAKSPATRKTINIFCAGGD